MYTFDGRVRYSEIDHKGTMTLPALINYFQDCSTFQSEDLGLGTEVLKQEKRAWILSYWQVEIQRYPALGEKITTGTFACGFDKFFGYRNFIMMDEQKEWVGRAYSVWIFMDMEKGRPVRPKMEEVIPYGEAEPLDIQVKSRKIRLPETSEALEPFPVRKCHIDTNEHVNNCQYVQMALDILPGEPEIKTLRVEYKKSAVLGDIIYPKIAKEDDRAVVLLCDEAGNPYAVAEF